MHYKKVCDICYKKCTRKWNLERHLYDVHEVHNDLSKVRIKQEIYVSDLRSNMVEPKHKFLNKDNNMNIRSIIKVIIITIICLIIYLIITFMDLITTHHHIHIQISMPNTEKKKKKKKD